jgi:ATP-dependent 26S proteasome regulatory subunit
MKMTFTEELVSKIKAGYPILAVNSPEEDRCIQEITLAGYLMADGRQVKLKPEQANQAREVLTNYSDPGMKLNGDTVEIDARKLIATLHFMGEQEDSRASFVEQLLQNAGYAVISWDRISGFDHLKSGSNFTEAPVEAIGAATNKFDPKQPLEKNLFPRFCIVVFKDLHTRLNEDDNAVRRMLRSVFAKNRLVNKEIRRPLLFLQPNWTPHQDIAHCVTLVDFDLPNEEQLGQEISFVEASIMATKTDIVKTCPAEMRKDLVHALRGFTQVEAVNALSECIVRHTGFVPEMLHTLHRIKAQTLKKDEVLEYTDADYIANLNEIGGFDNYLTWVGECKECYTEEAQAAGLKKPKGVLLLGVQGTGKSLVAMATAKMMRLPLIKYNFSAVFKPHVGESQALQNNTLKRINAQGPCVLLVDEADKAFAGMEQTRGDSGVGQQVFGRFLSWTAMENQDAFVIMTMNRLAGVPVELIRAGRLDKTFYTELPNPIEREEIIRIHLRKNNCNVEAYKKSDWKELVEATEDYVGAELEQLVIHAVRIGWTARKKVGPTSEELLTAAAGINSVTKLDKTGVEAIINFCQDCATPVSSKKKAAVKSVARTKGSVMVEPGSN